MRHVAVLSCVVLAACGGSAARHGGDGGFGVAPDGNAADALSDASADAAVDAPSDAAVTDAAMDAGPDCTGSAMLYESATLPGGSFNMLPAVLADGDDFIGVRFTTTAPQAITCLGATIYDRNQLSPGVTMVMAIVPLDATTDLPMTTDLSDAIGYTIGVIPSYPPTTLPAPPSSAMFPAAFTLPAGTWGLVVASDRLGVPFHEGDLPINVTPSGSPSFFHYTESGDTQQTPGVWSDGLADSTVRLFVMVN